VKFLCLRRSPDLKCANLLCTKVGEPCICRLGVVLQKLVSVKALSLSENDLTEIPSSLWELHQLHFLDLSRNLLVDIPGDIGKLQNLQQLDVSGNPLQRPLPTQLLELPHLVRLRVDTAAARRLPFGRSAWEDAGRVLEIC